MRQWKRIRLLILILTVWLPTQAFSAGVTIKNSSLIKQRGDGWALVEPNIDAYKSMLMGAGQGGSTEYAQADQYRDKDILVVTTVRGLTSYGLPQAYVQKKLQENGYTYPVSSSKMNDGIGPIVIDVEAVNGIFGAGGPLSHSPASKNAGLASAQSFKFTPSPQSCGDKHRSKAFELAVSNDSFSKNTSIGSFADLGVNLGLGATGEASIEVFYKEDRSYWSLCQTYDVDYKHHIIKADVDFVNTTLGLSGSVYKRYEKNLYKQEIPFFRQRGDFWVWIVQFEYKIEFGTRLSVDLIAEARATLAYEAEIDGKVDIEWKCVNTDCDPLKPDVINLDYTPRDDLQYGVEASITLDPSLTAYVNADLDIYWGLLDIVEAEAGVKVSAPLTLWGYYGNTCSDGNNDNVNEVVEGVSADWVAKVDAYWRIGAFNSQGQIRSISFSLPGWGTVYEYDLEYKKSVWKYRKHLWFNDFLNPSTTFTPVLNSARPVARNNALMNVKLRSCYPFDQKVAIDVDWGDGTRQRVNTSPDGLVLNKNWASTGIKNVTLTLIDDEFGRDFGAPYSTVAQVIVTETGEPPAPVRSVFVVDAPFGYGVNFGWSAPVGGNPDSYKVTVVKVVNGKSTYSHSTLSGSSTRFYTTTSGMQYGETVRFLIKACDQYGFCSSTKSTQFTVGSPAGDI